MTASFYFVVPGEEVPAQVATHLRRLWPFTRDGVALRPAPELDGTLFILHWYTGDTAERAAAVAAVEYLVGVSPNGRVWYYQADEAMGDSALEDYERPLHPEEIVEEPFSPRLSFPRPLRFTVVRR